MKPLLKGEDTFLIGLPTPGGSNLWRFGGGIKLEKGKFEEERELSQF